MIQGPLYVLFEGVNLSGKSTLSKKVAMALLAQGQGGQASVVDQIAFPSKEPIGVLIREVLEGKVTVDPASMMYLFVADAIDYDKNIVSRLAHEHIVICDRHTTISGARVYQRKEHTLLDIERVFATVRGRLLVPDITFIVDIPVEVALQRKEGRLFKDLYERPDVKYLEETRQLYLDAAAELGATVLDGTRPPEQLVTDVLVELETFCAGKM